MFLLLVDMWMFLVLRWVLVGLVDRLGVKLLEWLEK